MRWKQDVSHAGCSACEACSMAAVMRRTSAPFNAGRLPPGLLKTPLTHQSSTTFYALCSMPCGSLGFESVVHAPASQQQQHLSPRLLLLRHQCPQLLNVQVGAAQCSCTSHRHTVRGAKWMELYVGW